MGEIPLRAARTAAGCCRSCLASSSPTRWAGRGSGSRFRISDGHNPTPSRRRAMGITIGMIGLSHPHSPAYLRTLDALASVEGVVACDADSELRERVAREHPKVRSSCAEPGELWERADVPVVLVALPTNRVPDTVISAARAGKHIFCEKPCARSAREMQPMLAALEA